MTEQLQKGLSQLPKKNLLDQIEQKRAEMYQAASISGFCSTQAIKYSQELDLLLNEYEQKYIKKPIN
jgi:stage 0 sporulation regulatory protein